MYNFFLFIAAITPLVVILMTYLIFFNKRIGIALREIDNVLRFERLTYLYAAFGPHLFITHFTVHIGMNEHTLVMAIGAILTLLAVTFIKEHIMFALAALGPLLVMTHFTVIIGLNVDTLLMILGIIFTIAALVIMEKRPEI